MPRSRASAPAVAILATVLGAYVIGTCSGLSVYPRVGADEPWIAAAPYKLATQGIFGSDLFTGLAGMERHHYQHMPVYPLLEAAVFKAFGVGVAQMRLLSAIFGLLLLVAVFLVGRLVADERVGLAAVLILVLVRVADGGEATGILLLDRARINRYDIAVPAFGLLAFHQFIVAERSRRPWGYAAAGFLSALASLSHLYGIFWVPALIVLLIARGGAAVMRQPPMGMFMAGVLAGWLPWLAYVGTGWSDYLGQMRTVSERFDVFSPGFYVTNLLTTSGPVSLGWIRETIERLPANRIGAWVAIAGLPAGLAAIISSARGRMTHPIGALATAAAIQLTLFILLIWLKTESYMIALWPLGALVLAWLVLHLWDSGRRPVRFGLALLAAALAVEGAGRLGHARTVARQTTSYDWFTSEVARCVPPGSLVLGLQHYWLGLRQYPYRTWLLPLMQTNPRFTDAPVPFDEAVERIDPDVILIDRYMAEMFALTADPEDPLHRLSVEYQRFLARHRLSAACVVRDRTYGTMEVYRVDP
jgi:4-amino-4-deoxy-L-arabinose transferase-like glycosyltransferase